MLRNKKSGNELLTIPRTMRAAVYRGVNDIRIETLPVPSIRSDELLVRVAACGVCPTDIKKIHHGTVPPPRVFGHETAGIVVRSGARVRQFRPGDRVGLHHHVPCLECHACRHGAYAQCETYKRTGITAGFEPAGGGYAEYVRVMPFVLPGVVRIPKGNDLAEGAMLEPVNTVLKAVRRLRLLPGDCVLVAGQGPIGLMFTRLLALQKIRVIATDLFDERLAVARRFGASVVMRGDDAGLPDVVRKLTRRSGLDAVVLAVPSNRLVTEAIPLLRGGGQLLVFAHTKRGDAVGIDLSSVCVDEKDVIGSYSSDFRLQDEVARLVFSRQLDVRPLITHEFPLEQTSDAVALAATPTPTALKVIVRQLQEVAASKRSSGSAAADAARRARA